jgi:transcription initiation factor TFIIB
MTVSISTNNNFTEIDLINKDLVCPECEESTIIQDEITGEIVCTNCGFVIKESILNKEVEIRAFTRDEKESRVRTGKPLSYSLHDKGLSTVIKIGKYVNRKRIQPSNLKQMYRLQKWQTMVTQNSNKGNRLAKAMSELQRLSDKLNIPWIIKEEAALIYRKILNMKLTQGRSTNAMMAASLYAACRTTGIQRSLKDIVKKSLNNKKEIFRCYRFIKEKLDLTISAPLPELKVSKIAEKAGLGEAIQRKAIEILRKAKQLKTISGKDPIALAASALYIACRINHKKCSQIKLAEAAEITDVTIRNRYKNLIKDLNIHL